MAVIKIKPGLFWVGSMDWDRRIFDEIVGLPDGTSYNSYIVKGSEKIALIDSVDPSKEHELLDNLIKCNIKNIDYIVSNHAEMDHSGCLDKIIDMVSPEKVFASPKSTKLKV